MNDLLLTRTADISPCGRYRYLLTRQWSDAAPLPFVMLNPSIADADLDDPTIRRCIGFARREGAGGIVVANLFALRSTDPAALRSHAFAFGAGNYDALHKVGAMNCPVVCAWGVGGSLNDGDKTALGIMRDAGADLWCLGRTKDGHPRHPLYVRSDQKLEDYP